MSHAWSKKGDYLAQDKIVSINLIWHQILEWNKISIFLMYCSVFLKQRKQQKASGHMLFIFVYSSRKQFYPTVTQLKLSKKYELQLMWPDHSTSIWENTTDRSECWCRCHMGNVYTTRIWHGVSGFSRKWSIPSWKYLKSQKRYTSKRLEEN